jgi:plastocyanin
MRTLLISIAAAVSLLGMGSTAGERPGARTHTVTMEGLKFVPESITVAVGDTVVWVNKDLVAHTATSSTGAFDSKMIAPDKSWKLTVRTPGEFAYVCTYHVTMTATLRVK